MKKEIHMICNAHIDPIWQWDWAEGVSAVLSTFSSAVRLAEKFDYVFCHNEVTVYKYVEEYAPMLFERIKELVKLGRWHIMGGWYLQPDCNMPSGESFVRQIREGQRYFLEKFGVSPTTAINFDPFGHSAGLVQIIKKCGQDSYIFMRPYPRELQLPSEQFIWRGLDGSEIKAARAASYNSPLGKSAETIKRRADAQDFPVSLVLWGVGNHGGGPSEKDLADIERELLTSEDTKYIHSTPEAFFEKISPEAVWDKSLRISMPGCYTSMYRVKRLHAELERELYLAERISAIAYAKGALKNYPEEELRVAVEDLCNAQFHDVLPGTSVQCGEDAGIRLLNHGILTAERAKIRAFFALSEAEAPADEGEYPMVIFNPHPYELKDNVECEFMLADQNWDENKVSSIRIVNGKGEPVPHQIIKEESNLNLDWRKRIIFEADMKPLALTRYSVYISFADKVKDEREDAFVFDNGRKYVRINKNTGILESYRIDGVEYIGEGFGIVSFDDNADPWAMSTSQLLRLGTNESPFELSSAPSGPFLGMKPVQVVENGDIYIGIEAFFENHSSRARILYKIYKNSDDIDIDLTLYMSDRDRMIKLKVPTANDGSLIAETAFGTEELYKDSRENVMGRFVAIDSGDLCLAILNRGVYGNHFENGAIYLSLVRGVTYCAHPICDRELIPSDRFTKKIDQGENNYSFRLTVAKRELLLRKTQEFTMSPIALNIFPIKRENATLRDFPVSLSDTSVAITAIKKADGRDAIIFRLHNNTEDERSTYIEVAGERLLLTFGKYEVKTVLYESGTLKEYYELLI